MSMLIDDCSDRRVVFFKCDGAGEMNGLDEPLYSFSVESATDKGENMVNCSTISLDNAIMSLIKPLMKKKWFNDMLQGLKDLDALTADLQRIVQGVIDQKNNVSIGESNTATIEFMTERTIALMHEISMVGWGNITDVSETMEKIGMKIVDSKGREHLFDVVINSSYPHSPPTIIADLPTPVVMDWSSRGNLTTVRNAVKRQIDKYAAFFDVLSDLDSTCRILEPIKPTFTTSKRRIVIDKTCSVLLNINHERPLDFCQIRFMGPVDKVRTLQSAMDRNLHKWQRDDTNISIRDRIESLLEVTLPAPRATQPSINDGGKRARVAADKDDDYLMECGICYSFIVGEGDEALAPDQVCPKVTCQRVFHYHCLSSWLQGAPSSRSSFGTLFGHCPYCNEWLSATPRKL